MSPHHHHSGQLVPAPRDALLVIDVQRDFCPGGALAVPKGDQVVAPINRLIDRFDTVIATQDWHPAGHSSFASSHPGRAPYDQINLSFGPQTLWPDHCVVGSDGAALHPDLRADRASLILRKGTRRELDSYSAFFENDRVTTTGLAGYLRERNLCRLVLTGLATDFCVYWTARDAVALGFTVVLVADACQGLNVDGSLDKALAAMADLGVWTVRSDDISDRPMATSLRSVG